LTALVGLVASLLVFHGAHGGFRSPDRTRLGVLGASDVSSIVMRNEYSGKGAVAPGSGYPFLANKLLVEPHRVTTFDTVDASRSATSRVWAVSQASNCGVECAQHTYKELVPQHTFTTLGNLDLQLVEVYDDGSTAAITTELYCVYVRRDIRKLSEADRNKYFDIFKSMKDTPDATGKALYGADFHTLDFFVGKHLDLAGARGHDHMHVYHPGDCGVTDVTVI
jgi:hypothetical protein